MREEMPTWFATPMGHEALKFSLGCEADSPGRRLPICKEKKPDLTRNTYRANYFFFFFFWSQTLFGLTFYIFTSRIYTSVLAAVMDESDYRKIGDIRCVASSTQNGLV